MARRQPRRLAGLARGNDALLAEVTRQAQAWYSAQARRRERDAARERVLPVLAAPGDRRRAGFEARIIDAFPARRGTPDAAPVEQLQRAALKYAACPKCGALQGERCWRVGGAGYEDGEGRSGYRVHTRNVHGGRPLIPRRESEIARLRRELGR